MAEQASIDLYTWSTPNGRKVSIMLEELELPYRVIPIDIIKGDQFQEEFLRISPNNKIPAIVDHDSGTSLMESGAILMYLANKTGKLMAPGGEAYWQQLQWLMWQMGGLGPMAGQAHHFLKFNPGKSDYAAKRYGDETKRLYGVLEKQLEGREYIAGDYSIADISSWPWISRFEWQQIAITDYPNVCDWYKRVASRPAVQRGYAVPEALEIPMP
ncbi:MAG: glutathione S-transferase N-terminal domain-containing protein [Pseudomonadales bacterium]|nr:glutathione S-transferase N-terminal domain-containing protein [Pseudomonadales bacterium]